MEDNQTPEYYLAKLLEARDKKLQEQITTAVTSAVSKLLSDQQRNSTTLLKEGEVVKIYKISKSFLTTLRKEHGLKCIKIRSSVLYDKKTLDLFFQEFLHD